MEQGVTTFDQSIEFICRKICEELGQEAEEKIDGYEKWKYHQNSVRQWLIDEAFRKVRQDYWNGKYKGQDIETLLSKMEPDDEQV
jgi:hypothetical protein